MSFAPTVFCSHRHCSELFIFPNENSVPMKQQHPFPSSLVTYTVIGKAHSSPARKGFPRHPRDRKERSTANSLAVE